MNKAVYGRVAKISQGVWFVEGPDIDEFANGAHVVVTTLDAIGDVAEDEVVICEGCSGLFKYDLAYGDEEGTMFCENCWYKVLDEAMKDAKGDDE